MGDERVKNRLPQRFQIKKHRHQPNDCLPSCMLQCDGSFKQLEKLSEQHWRDVNIACIDFALINGCWIKDYTFGQCESLVHTINGSANVEDIARIYPSVRSARCTHELHDGKYKLLMDPSADVSGPLAHMKRGPIKDKDSCVRKATKIHMQERSKGNDEARDEVPAPCTYSTMCD